MDFSSALDALTNTYVKIDATKQQRRILNAQESQANAEALANSGKGKASADNTKMYLIGGGVLALVVVGALLLRK